MTKVGEYRSRDYWETVRAETGRRGRPRRRPVLLAVVRRGGEGAAGLACEMIAYDPTGGELRTHYAGFFDPGFGYDGAGALKGSRAALEVRAHDVPFVIDHGQHVCKLTFERMVCEPSKLYGDDIGSNYQGQVDTLSKHFRREPAEAPRQRSRCGATTRPVRPGELTAAPHRRVRRRAGRPLLSCPCAW